MTRRVLLSVLGIFGLVILFSAMVLACRHEQRRRGASSPSEPSAITSAYGDTVPRTGRFTARLAYTLFGAPGSGETSSDVLWDDAWFTADPTGYNHDLARASAVLSTLAYSESGYYQAASTQPPYMEDALTELGFSRISTESYRYRSEVVDELLDAVTLRADGVAYTLASKVLPSSAGVPRELILVAVRGSYGSEWLSNFNLFADRADEAAALLSEQQESHHPGYEAAAQEIRVELARWREAAHERGHETSVLLCGHSRGGAVASLLAAMLDDDARDDELVYAYTFASPRTTVTTAAAAESYRNVFNIINPADVVPALPLAGWGYTRCGIDVLLPAVDDVGFGDAFEAMERRFEELTGGTDAYLPKTKRAIDRLVDEASVSVPTLDDVLTPSGMAGLSAACAAHLDPLTVLRGHYPSVYLAWLDVVDW